MTIATEDHLLVITLLRVIIRRLLAMEDTHPTIEVGAVGVVDRLRTAMDTVPRRTLIPFSEVETEAETDQVRLQGAVMAAVAMKDPPVSVC